MIKIPTIFDDNGMRVTNTISLDEYVKKTKNIIKTTRIG